MEAIKTSYANVVLTGEGCLDLPAACWPAEDRQGMLNFETAWKPTADELADLLAGGALYITHLVPKGLGFPPVMTSTRTLFEDSREANWESTREAMRLTSSKLARTLKKLDALPEDQALRVAALLKAVYSTEDPEKETRNLFVWLMKPFWEKTVEEMVADIFPDLVADFLRPKPLETLTIEEMRQMDGEPVWVVLGNDAPETAHCCVVCEDLDSVGVPGLEAWYAFEDYGKNWLAYRDRPKGGKGNE